MDIDLAKGEKLLKEYEYSSVNTKKIISHESIHKKLIVTNKRIINESTNKKDKDIEYLEMPISDAIFLRFAYNKASNILLLILGFLFLALSVPSLILYTKNIIKFNIIFLIVFFIFIAAGIVLIFIHMATRDAQFCCEILTKDFINSAMYINTATFDRKKRGSKSSKNKITVQVNSKVSKNMIKELGALIIDIKNGVYDNCEEPKEQEKEESKQPSGEEQKEEQKQ